MYYSFPQVNLNKESRVNNREIGAKLREIAELHRAVAEDTEIADILMATATCLTRTLAEGKRVYVAGNGGSAADSQHFAAEFVGHFSKPRKGYPVTALTTDTSFLTAWSNDDDYANVFSRQLEAHAREHDLFIGISTSGNSKNIVRAFQSARELRVRTIALLGGNGGEVLSDKLADLNICVSHTTETPRIQEIHIITLHLLAELTEKALEET